MKKLSFIAFLLISVISFSQTNVSTGNKVKASVNVSEFEKAPYLLYTGKNTEMLIIWQTVTGKSCRVDWGTDLTYTLGSQITTEYGTAHQHKLTLTGLTPSTKYYYKVTVNNTESRTGDFITGVLDNETVVSLYTYGDTRTYPANHDAVAKKILDEIALDPKSQSIMMFSGDFVQYGDKEDSWTNEFFDPQFSNIQTLIARMPYLTTLGNHEGQGLLFAKYYPYPQFASNRYYYSFDYGPVHFTIIDQFTPYTPGSAQYAWLEDDLAKSTKPWKIIMDHEPGWTATPTSGGHGNNLTIQNFIQPLCLKYGVQFVISGHNHFYSRADVNNVMHITTGGGGAPLYTPSQREYIVKMDKSYHFCKIDIDKNNLKLTAQRSDGSIIESFDYVKSNEPGILVWPSIASLKPSATQQLSALIYPSEYVNEPISWTSSNNAVATVSSTGLVLAISDGKATITASILGGKTATSSITVITSTTSNYLDDCDALSGWNSYLTLNSSVQKQGTGCFENLSANSTEFSKVFITPYNSGATPENGKVKLWYWVSLTELGTRSIRVEIGSGGKADTDEYQWTMTGLTDGWNQITLDVNKASKLGNPDLAAINWFRIYSSGKAVGVNVTTRVDAIELAPNLESAIKSINNDEKTVSIYPNPLTKSTLSIDMVGFQDMRNVQVRIVNLLGQSVYQKSIDNTAHLEINTSGILNKSIYFVSVEGGQSQFTRKLVVK